VDTTGLKEKKMPPGFVPLEQMGSKPIPEGYVPLTEYKPEEHPELQPEFTTAELAKKTLPFVGDVLGGLAATKVPIPISLLTKAPKAAKGLQLLSRMAGSGAGGFGGSVAEQAMGDEEIDYREAGIQGAIGAGAELGFVPIGSMGSKLAKPLFPLFSKITFAGQGLSKVLSNKLVEKTVGRSNDFLYSLAPKTVKKQTVDIDDIVLKLEGAKNEISTIYESYKAPLRELGKEGKFITTNTDEYLSFLGQKYKANYPQLTDKQLVMRLLSEEFGYTPGGAYGKQLKKILEGGDPPSSDDFMWLVDHVFREKPKSGGSFLKVTPSQQENRRALKKAYLMDMDEAIGGTKDQADKLYMEYKDFLVIKKIFDSSVKDAGLGAQTIDPFKLSRNIFMQKDNVLKIDEKRVQAGLEPFWPKLEEEAKFYGELVPYFKQATSNIGVRPGMMGTAGSLASAVASAGTPFAANVGAYSLFGPAGIPLVEGFGAISAYSLLSPMGKKAVQIAFRHTTKTTGKLGLHLGSQLIDFE
jgi:hypothetical protein